MITTFVAGSPELVLHGHTGCPVPLPATPLEAKREPGGARSVLRHIDAEVVLLAGHFRALPAVAA